MLELINNLKVQKVQSAPVRQNSDRSNMSEFIIEDEINKEALNLEYEENLNNRKSKTLAS